MKRKSPQRRLKLGRTKRRKSRAKPKKRAKWRFGKQQELFAPVQLDLFK